MQIKKQRNKAGNLIKESKKILNINKILCVLLTVVLSLAAVTVNADVSEDREDSASSEVDISQITFKNIEEIEVGDIIISYDSVNDALITTEVTKVSRHVLTSQALDSSHAEIIDKNTTYYLNIIIKQRSIDDSYLADTTLLQVTPNHPLYVVNNPPSLSALEKPSYRIVAAGNVKTGDKLFNLNGEIVEVLSVEKVHLAMDNRVHRTYNVETERYHNYFANGILVNDKNDDLSTAKTMLRANNDDSDDNDGDVNKNYRALSRLLLRIVDKFPELADLFSSIPIFKDALDNSEDTSKKAIDDDPVKEDDADDGEDKEDEPSEPAVASPDDVYDDARSAGSLFNLKLYKGWNFITIPFENEYTAKTLGENIPGCECVTKFDASTQEGLTHVVGKIWDDFPIEDGVGYYVYVTDDAEFTVTGNPLTYLDPVTVDLYKGDNYVGWFKSEPVTASALIDDIDNCVELMMYDNITKNYIIYPGEDFIIEKGMGIHVKITDEEVDTEKPSQVKDLKVTDAHDGRLDLSWDPATDNIGVDYYRIYRDTGIVGVTSDTSYQDSGLVNDKTYSYRVSAVDTSGNEGDKSNPVDGTPTASGDTEKPSNVTGLKVTDAHDGKLDLAWNQATDNIEVDYYIIYRDNEIIITTSDTTYPDSGLTNDQTYTYQVSAVDTSGNEGNRSNPVSGIPTATPVIVEYGWVYGVVYLRYNDDVLLAKNTTVCLYPQNNNDQNFCTTTNRVGEYIIDNIPTGYYWVKAQKDEYISTSTSIIISKNSVTTVDLFIDIDDDRWEIEEAIDEGDLGGEINVKQKDEDVFDYEIKIYESIDISPVSISKSNISILVKGDEYILGKTVLINVDYNVFDIDEDIIVEYDGETISKADNIGDVLNPNNDGHHPEYLIVYTAENVQFLVSIPKFSEHTIDIFTFQEIKEKIDLLGLFSLYFFIICLTIAAVALHIKHIWGK